MQDKEFDELFKNRFEDAEVAPSSNLWNNIEEKLVVKRKRIFPVYWGAAAAVIAAVTAGLLFYEGEKPVNDVVAVQHPVIVNEDKPAAVQDEPEAIQNNVVAEQNNVVPGKQVVSRRQMEYQSVSARRVNPADAGTGVESDINGADRKIIFAVSDAEKKDLLAMQPSPVISHPDYKELQLKQEVIKLPKAIAKPVEEVMLASADVPSAARDEEVVNENKQADSKGIRNVGDLINYVVDKVDKREEKFIQFNRDDDDNSSSIALNIGMFRISPKKHK